MKKTAIYLSVIAGILMVFSCTSFTDMSVIFDYDGKSIKISKSGLESSSRGEIKLSEAIISNHPDKLAGYLMEGEDFKIFVMPYEEERSYIGFFSEKDRKTVECEVQLRLYSFEDHLTNNIPSGARMNEMWIFTDTEMITDIYFK